MHKSVHLSQICSLLRNGWTEIMDGEQMTPFAFSNEEIVTYDNTVSIVTKVGNCFRFDSSPFTLTLSSGHNRQRNGLFNKETTNLSTAFVLTLHLLPRPYLQVTTAGVTACSTKRPPASVNCFRFDSPPFTLTLSSGHNSRRNGVFNKETTSLCQLLSL